MAKYLNLFRGFFKNAKFDLIETNIKIKFIKMAGFLNFDIDFAFGFLLASSLYHRELRKVEKTKFGKD